MRSYYIVREVIPLNDYKLKLLFEDGKRSIYDMRPLLKDFPFTSLKDKKLFNQVHINFPTISWTDDIDIAPEELYINSKEI